MTLDATCDRALRACSHVRAVACFCTRVIFSRHSYQVMPPVNVTVSPRSSDKTSSGITPLPPAHHFDILPPLHQLLSRLEPTLNNYTSSSDAIESAPLAYRDVSTSAQFIKSRIRLVLSELAGLGDMDRTIDEQELETVMLRDKINEQRAVLRDLADLAGSLAKNET